MANQWDEMMDEKDFDEDIKKRESLIEEAKNLDASLSWNELSRKITELKRRWKRISYWESAYEVKMAEEFDAVLDVFYAKRNEIYQNSQVLKQELISKAKELSESTNFNKATDEMNELMRQWKAAGNAGKEEDALWESFNTARQTFFDRKRKFIQERQDQFANAHKIKEELIVEAGKYIDSTDWQKTSEALRDLMNQWKAAGSAGRDHEEDLWSRFNETCQKFYSRREEHYKELHEVQNGNYAAKKELLEQAKSILDLKAFTKENTAKMKELGAEWKKIGSCGREKEDRIWNEFRGVMDAYFDGLKEFNEQKHQQWRQRMVDNRKRKQDLIQNQRRLMKRMQDELPTILSQREAEEMEDRIQEKEEFIQELEAQLAELDKALEE